MPTVDEIRARHDPACSGPCDVAVLLAAIKQRDTALLRARDELEALTGEPQPWIDAAMSGGVDVSLRYAHCRPTRLASSRRRSNTITASRRPLAVSRGGQPVRAAGWARYGSNGQP